MRKASICLFFCLCGLAGCETTMPKHTESNFVARTSSYAKQLEQQGELVKALYQWRVLESLDTENVQARMEIKRLRQSIQKKLHALNREFIRQAASNTSRKQRLLALRLLLLDGSHTKARAYLMERDRALALMTQSRKDREALESQASRRLKVEKQVQQEEKLTNTRKRKALDLYKAGLKILSTDLDSAIKLFEGSLELDPENKQAARQLKRATKMRLTLQKINGKK